MPLFLDRPDQFRRFCGGSHPDDWLTVPQAGITVGWDAERVTLRQAGGETETTQTERVFPLEWNTLLLVDFLARSAQLAPPHVPWLWSVEKQPLTQEFVRNRIMAVLRKLKRNLRGLKMEERQQQIAVL